MKRREHALFKVRVVKLKAPVGPVEHALIKCPRCLKGIGVTKAMLLGADSIICKGALGNTGLRCNAHFYFRSDVSVLHYIGDAALKNNNWRR